MGITSKAYKQYSVIQRDYPKAYKVLHSITVKNTKLSLSEVRKYRADLRDILCGNKWVGDDTRIIAMFDWTDTKQGYNYWYKLHNALVGKDES